jgi:hypothetical protein
VNSVEGVIGNNNIITVADERRSLISDEDVHVSSEGHSSGTHLNSFVIIGKRICEVLETHQPADLPTDVRKSSDLSVDSRKSSDLEKSYSMCSSSDSAESYRLVLLPQSEIDQSNKERITDCLVETFSFQSNNDLTESILSTGEESNESLSICAKSVEQESNACITQSSMKILLLLVSNESSSEVLHLEFNSDNALVDDVLDRVMVVKDLRCKHYRGICNISGDEFPTGSPLKSIVTKENEFMICIPEGITAAESAKLAAPLMHALKRHW